MKCTIPEISWHNRDPVLSVDIQPKINEKEGFYRLASGGTDSHVLIWYLTCPQDDVNSQINLELAVDLNRHQRAVNVVRWSPSGELLASGDDESFIFIWKKKEENEVVNLLDTTNDQDKEVWITLKILRGHMEDVYDISWSPDSLSLISGSVDNTAMVWNVDTGKSQGILSDHKGFVQGVAWDPANKYLATLSTDRTFRIFDVETRRVISRSSKCLLPVPEESELYGKITRLYHDDTLQTFFRRLSFSPDGQIIVTPSGVCDQDQVAGKPLNASYIYTRYSTKQPVAILPSPDQFTVCIKFCPVLFHLRKYTEDSNGPLLPLPYRMVFAVATKSCVFLYDTQQVAPFGIISNIHYTRLTDLTWSSDGRVLVVSSTDGFCSLLTFTENELGDLYDDSEIKSSLREAGMANSQKTKKRLKKRKSKVPQKIVLESPKIEVISKNIELEEKVSGPIPEAVLKDAEILSKIIKSDERFSPQKKDRPVTPIAIRRHPRITTVDTPQLNGESGSVSQPKTPKTPTPIAVRRQPRTLIPTEVRGTNTDEAVDAWPIGTEKPSTVEVSYATKANNLILCDGDTAHANAIRLVIEADSQDEEMPDEKKVSESNDESKKTPRRVPLITLSTPRSKKKM